MTLPTGRPPRQATLAGGYPVGVRPTLVVLAVLYTGVILGAYLRGHLRELDDHQTDGVEFLV